MNRKGQRSQELLLRRVESELDGVYDLIHQVFGDEAISLAVLQSTLKRALRRSKKEQYERYLKLWVLRLAVEAIQRAYPRYLAERLPEEVIPLEFLSLEEKLVLFLQDRVALTSDEIAGVLQIQAGRVGRSLCYAREKLSWDGLGLRWSDEDHLALRERISFNSSLEQTGRRKAPWAYLEALRKCREFVVELPTKKFSEIESDVRQTQLLPLLARPEGIRWQDLAWHHKLGLEAGMLGVVGLFAVVVLPWAFNHVNADAFVEGRFAEVFKQEAIVAEAPEVEGLTADRLLASVGSPTPDFENAAVSDEFADVDFPSGEAYEAGAAAVAPSREKAAVYRLIVQSAAPADLIPQVRNLFAQKNVREREFSGRKMPGGVFFDGVTNVGAYPNILKEVEKLGETKTYSVPGASKNPTERARVIVWVQQI
ncbi:MAG: sigma-70 family RNA polymerase sigma factor [Proteobacteria bacterium]|nr:MAG: sigma-70 family RNA polymerase sigma factor [Pseudomonadota bacterium]